MNRRSVLGLFFLSVQLGFILSFAFLPQLPDKDARSFFHQTHLVPGEPGLIADLSESDLMVPDKMFTQEFSLAIFVYELLSFKTVHFKPLHGPNTENSYRSLIFIEKIVLRI